MRNPVTNPRPPAIVLGGAANALSIVWNLSAIGVEVHAINHPGAAVRYSRHCHWIPVPITFDSTEQSWAAYLLGRNAEHLRGAVLLAACDEGIEMLSALRESLAKRFRLDLCHLPAQACMLNKLSTYQAARAAGVPTPKFWVIESPERLESLRGELLFPLLIKPLIGHEFKKKFASPLVVVNDFDELSANFELIHRARIRTFLVEFIPGTDDRLCSYYTYLDETGSNLFDFTKRVLRRFPLVMGGGCYHITDHVPEIKELSLRLFRHVGLRGLANTEFKWDERDGKYKLIECNARFTAADRLVAASGVNLAPFVYHRIIGQPWPTPGAFRDGVRLWSPARDFAAYRQLSRKRMLSFGQWLGSIAHPQIFPFFRWTDPLPAVMNGARSMYNYARRKLRLYTRHAADSDRQVGRRLPARDAVCWPAASLAPKPSRVIDEPKQYTADGRNPLSR